MIALDIDGTLLDYDAIPGQPPVVNTALIQELATNGVKQVALVTNQGGLAFGWPGRDKIEGRKYPSPADFITRLSTLAQALNEHSINVRAVYVSLYHPKANPKVLEQIRATLYELVPLGLASLFLVYINSAYRKPSPLMLQRAGATVYYGDSQEDEQTAQAAGVEFVPVERFMGG